MYGNAGKLDVLQLGGVLVVVSAVLLYMASLVT
jgi:hypothetical protein